MERGKKIIVDNGVRAKLLPIASYPTIREALKGKIDTPKNLRIRKAALLLGGVEVEEETTDQITDTDIDGNCTPII